MDQQRVSASEKPPTPDCATQLPSAIFSQVTCLPADGGISTGRDRKFQAPQPVAMVATAAKPIQRSLILHRSFPNKPRVLLPRWPRTCPRMPLPPATFRSVDHSKTD